MTCCWRSNNAASTKTHESICLRSTVFARTSSNPTYCDSSILNASFKIWNQYHSCTHLPLEDFCHVLEVVVRQPDVYHLLLQLTSLFHCIRQATYVLPQFLLPDQRFSVVVLQDFVLLAEIVDLRLELLPHSVCLLVEKVLLAVYGVEEFVLFAVHEGSGLEDGLLYVFDLDLVLRAEDLNLVLELLDEAGESGDFKAFFVVGGGELILLVLAGLLKLVVLLVEVIDLLVELIPFIMPIRGLLLLSGKPIAVLFLLLVQLLLQLFDIPLVQA